MGLLHDPVTWYDKRKLHSGAFKAIAAQGGLVRVALFWKPHCATCVPACVICYHVTGSGKGPISTWQECGKALRTGMVTTQARLNQHESNGGMILSTVLDTGDSVN